MPLPNFLIVGAPRCGTTSLYHYLRQHPDVYMSPVKEPRYFPCAGVLPGDHVPLDRAGYGRLFEGVAAQRAIGEASAQYLHGAGSAERIAAELPDARIIVSLRNPADRAYSSYLGRLRRGVERRAVEHALRPGEYHFDTSLYHDALARYLAVFGRQRVRILLFDDLESDAAAVFSDVCGFLEIDARARIDTAKRHNAATEPKWPGVHRALMGTAVALRKLVPARMRGSGRAAALLLRRPPPLCPRLRAALLREFEPDIRRTEELVERDLSGWLA